MKDEMPKGIPFSRALELLEQGYTIENVSARTGFPVKLLAAQNVGEPSRPQNLVPIPVSYAGVEEEESTPLHVPGEIPVNVTDYRLTDHAIVRMLKRDISYAQVMEVIAAKGRIGTMEHPDHRPGTVRYIYGDISVVVNPTERCVITVGWRWEEPALTRTG